MADRDRLKRRLIDELFDMGIIHTDPILDRIIDVCQANAGAKGETVSAPAEPLQSDNGE